MKWQTLASAGVAVRHRPCRRNLRQLAELLSETRVGLTNKGIVVDPACNVWVASGGDNRAYRLDSSGTVLPWDQRGGLDGAWGLSLDGKNNVWVANFGPLRKDSTNFKDV